MTSTQAYHHPVFIRIFCRVVMISAMWVTFGNVYSAGTNSPQRIIPRSLPHHPGNVFLVGEPVKIPAPANASGGWKAFDVDDRLIASGPAGTKIIGLNNLSVGYYHVIWEGGQKISLAVLNPLVAPIPQDSPVCIMTWFAGFYILNQLDRLDDAANLTALAGVNGIRDATAWPWQIGTDGQFIANGSRKAESFDKVTEAARRNGLQLLLYIQPGTPPQYAVPPDWGGRTTYKFPADLREYAAFARHTVARAGSDVAWETWNEPDGIGGMHLGSELTAAAKVFTLAAKSVNPDGLIGMGGANAGKAALTEAMDRNGYLHAVDTYNYHNHSDHAEALKKRRMLDPYTGNRPTWVTEYSYGAYSCLPKSSELTPESERNLANDIPKIFARGLHEGNERIYYFQLLSFEEAGNRQWGVLHRDLQPRPGYLALAATGRLLAGATPFGALTGLPADVEGWIFKALPDGQEKMVAIIWKNSGDELNWQPPSSVTAWDVWGRPLDSAAALRLGSKPIYCVFNRNDINHWQIAPPRQRPEFAMTTKNELCPVVADFRLAERYKNNSGDFFLFSQSDLQLDFDIYNFAAQPLQENWQIKAPSGYTAVVTEQPGLLAPNGRRTLRANLRRSEPWRSDTDNKPLWLHLSADYGTAGKSGIAIRFVNCPSDRNPERLIPLSHANDNTKWKPNAANGTTLGIAKDGSWLKFNIAAGSAPNQTIGMTWAAPQYRLDNSERPAIDSWGITLRMHGANALNSTVLSLNLIKKNGAVWTCTLPADSAAIASPGGKRLILPFSWFAHIAYRNPDPEGKLLSQDIVAIEVVSISQPNSTIRFEVSDLAWVGGLLK